MASKSALVLGGGVAGVASALELADSGFSVHLVERESRLGGHSALFSCKATDKCSQCSVCAAAEKLARVRAAAQVSILSSSEVTALSGHSGKE